MKRINLKNTYLLKIIILSCMLLINSLITFANDNPFFYRTDLVLQAKENIKRYQWAKKLLHKKLEDANYVISMDESKLLTFIPTITPTRTCDCPHCGKSWLAYIWKWEKEKPNEMTCRICNKNISEKKFPSNAIFKFPDPSGKIQEIPYYKKGNKKFFIRSVIAVYKFYFISETVEILTEAWLLTGKKEYASKAVFLMNETAKSYPNFVLKEWDSKGNVIFRKKPTGRASKMSGWHYEDAIHVGKMARAYNAIKCGGLVKEEQIKSIEKGLLRSAGELLTAVSPKTGIVNDRAQRYAGVASIARALKDQKMMQWVTNKKTGFLSFIKQNWFPDGHWCERAPSYNLMAISNVYITPWVMAGYRAKKGAPPLDWTKSHLIKNIHTALFDVAWPNGDLPPINDSHFKDVTPPRLAEIAYAWSGEKKELGYLVSAYSGKVEENGNEFSLWNRDPAIGEKIKALNSNNITQGDRHWKNLAITQLRYNTKKHKTVAILDHGFYHNSHSHADKLQLLLWTRNREMVSDLGYIYWGHKLRTSWLNRTLSHNTVLVDTKDQYFKAKAKLIFKRFEPTVKVVEAQAPDTYKNVSVYRRTIGLIAELNDDPILVDIFRVQGGSTHDWSFHTEAPKLDFPNLKMEDLKSAGKTGPYRLLKNIKSTTTDNSWQANHYWPDGAGLRLWMMGHKGTQVIKAIAPGQRLKTQEGRKLPWLITRRKGTNLSSTFVSVLEPLDNKNGHIISVELVEEEPNKPGWPVIIKITGKTNVVWVASKTNGSAWQNTNSKLPAFTKKRFSVIKKPIK